MAQRTGAERLLGFLPRAASAGIVPALAATALLFLSGCGGSSGEEATVASKATRSSDARSSENKNAGQFKTSPAEEEQEKAAAKVRSSEGSHAGNVAGKHGPSVAVPSGEQEPKITPTQRRQATVASIFLASPATKGESPLPSTYTCDGKDIWPALEWTGVPSGTAEIVLFVMNVEPVNERLFFDWAVAGIDPQTDSLGIGKLPRGAVVGKNSFGQSAYSICPPQGGSETYMFILYALPKALSPKENFDPMALREEALGLAGNAGLMATSYARP